MLTLFVLWLTTSSLSSPLPPSQSLPVLDSQFARAAQAATRRKFQNASALLAGLGTSSPFVFPPSLEIAYNRASDDATNITFLSSLPPSYSPFPIRIVALTNANTTAIESLQDETDGVDDFEYFGPMSFGSMAQPLQIDFDTGSADLWVPVDCANCDLLSQLQAANSSSYRDSNQPFNVTYGSGFVMGTLAEDTVSLGPLTVYNQSFGAVSWVSENFAFSPNDGLAGMAFGAIANSRKPTFFENVIPQLPAPMFSVFMTRKRARGSELYLGGIDASKASEETISWVPVVSKTYWTVSMSAVSVNDARVPAGNVNVIVDTGTSFIYVPTKLAIAIYQQILGSAPAPDYGGGFYAYPCAAQIEIAFVLGSHTLALDPRDLNLGQHKSDSTRSTCIAAIVDGGPNFDFAILGDSFLKSFLTVFDYSHSARVGFVKSIDE